MEQWEQLQEIITKECIRPVFQPILSLKDGSVFGFEVLSRTTQSEAFHNVEEMFRYAENFLSMLIPRYYTMKNFA